MARIKGKDGKWHNVPTIEQLRTEFMNSPLVQFCDFDKWLGAFVNGTGLVADIKARYEAHCTLRDCFNLKLRKMATKKITCGACVHGVIECCAWRSVGLSVGNCPLKHGYETRIGANFKFSDVGSLSITTHDLNVRYETKEWEWEGQRLELSIPLAVAKEHPEKAIKMVNSLINMGNTITGEKVPKI